jgi:hypothetical protein
MEFSPVVGNAIILYKMIFLFDLLSFFFYKTAAPTNSREQASKQGGSFMEIPSPARRKYIRCPIVSLFFFFFVLNSQLSITRNAFNFGKVPFLVAQWTNTARFEPTLNTVEMKNVSTIAKGNAQTIVIGR